MYPARRPPAEPADIVLSTEADRSAWVSLDVMSTMRAALPSLRPSERRIAKYILADPASAIDLTITELAERCDTSIASVARLCQSLGIAGYSDFRLALASSIGRQEVALDRFGVTEGDILTTDDAATVVAKLAFHEARAIEATAASLDLEVLDRLAAAIAKAPRIDIYGSASSSLSAADLQQKLHRIGLVSYNWSDIHLALTSAAVLTEGCVAIGFSHSGLTVETAEALATASAAGATTALVTNFPGSPIAGSVDHLLITNASETRYRPGAMSGRIAQLAVIDFLFVRVAQRVSNHAVRALEATFNVVQAHRLDYRTKRSRNPSTG
jgi:DNA-binding MurR/RpiR family transcriptional regulator